MFPSQNTLTPFGPAATAVLSMLSPVFEQFIGPLWEPR
jgi:hypothetical protein